MRDVVAFCGQGNVACSMEGEFVGHIWLQRTISSVAPEVAERVAG
jgi:hypothetical protein